MIIKLFEFILESKVFIAICAVCMALATLLILNENLERHYFLFIFIFSATYMVYNVHTIPTFLLFIRKFSWENLWVSMTLLINSILAMGCFWNFKEETKIMLIPLIIISFLYYIPFNKYLEQFSLRSIPFLKIFLISYIWAAVTVQVPWLEAGINHDDYNLWLLFFERFVFIFSITIPFDIRDLYNDSHNKVITIPKLVGTSNAKMISYCLFVVYLVLTLLQFGPHALFFSRLICCLLLGFAIFNIRETSNHVYFTGLIDGGMILQLLLILLFNATDH